MAYKVSPTVAAAWTFVIHLVVIAAAFVVLVLVTLGLSIFANWLESLEQLPSLFVNTVFFLKYALFWLDIASFVVVVLVEAWSLLVELRRIHSKS